MVFSESNSNIGENSLKLGNTNIEQIGTNCKEKHFKFVGHVLDDKFFMGRSHKSYFKETFICQLCHKLLQKFLATSNKEVNLQQPF